MNLRSTVLLALIAASTTGLAVAQTPPSQDETAPSAASTPHQRGTTSSNAAEAPAANGAEPSSASTPHQQEATDGRHHHEQMMKDCMAKERASSSGMSKDQMKKACREQMKSSASPNR